MDQQQPGSSSVNRTLYPPSQPAPLYLDAENDYNHYLDEELISYNDPDQHLRLTRSATETIHEAISEDDRRRLAKKNRSNHNKRKFSRRASNRSSTVTSVTAQQQLLSAHNHPLPTNSIFNSKLNSKNSANQLNSQQQQHNHDPSGSSSNPPTQKFIPPMPIAPELDQDEEEADEHTRNLKELEDSPAADLQRKQTDSSRQQRRSIYVNLVLPTVQVDKYGDPIARYVRNKVRTTKYTIITFFPKNMWEQFRNVANVYFLVLIIFQVFPIFGAATPQVAMLPLVFILSVTALKDAFEDYRRYMLDNSVNNAACTKLGDWRNVNVPKAGGGTWWENYEWPWEKNQRVVDSIGQVHKITKGIRKLREREKDTFNTDFLRANDSQRQNSSEFRDDDALSDIQEGTAYQPGHSISSLPPPSTYRRRPSSDLVDYSTPTAGTAKWERTLWKKIEVGDILLLREDEAIPADLIVLSTSDPDGQCFVETKNLDGETNLKPRRACKTTRSIGNEEDVEHSHFVIESEAPNANLYAFNASVKYWTKDETEGQEHPLTEGRKLKKGSEKKKNTQWVIGLVIFTGKDTKIMLNQGDTPSKKPKISTETNYAVVVNFLILVLLCTVNAVGDGILQGTVKTSATFYEAGASVSSNAVLDALVTFGAALILFPIYRTDLTRYHIGIVRSIQALTIFRDIEMYYEPLNCPAEPKSWNFDKTGTLTQNVMEFQRCSISGISYGEGVTEAMVGAAKRRQADSSAIDDPLIEDLTNPHPTNSVHRKRMLDFWKTLAICHDVISSRNDLEPNQIEYKAESPDEAALVAAARDVGFVFLRRMGERLEIQAMGQLEQYHMLQMIAFNSSRKRMSTIVRCPDDKIRLLCKGADSIIMSRLKPDQDEDLKRRVNQDLESFASDGLRTLLIASREVSEEEYLEFQQEYKQASDSIGKDREELMEKVADQFERGLEILGATALEDKLQVGVPEAIEKLHEAGIKLWILTGDKLQTAIEIGYSCNLLKSTMEIMILSSDTEAGTRSQIEQGLEKLLSTASGSATSTPPSNGHEIPDRNNNDPIDNKSSPTGRRKSQAVFPATRPKDGYAVVIDGDTLRYALDGSLKANFLALTIQCETVVCCRVSPAQKALTVKLVKEGRNAMTLAIGDGANDVAMIQEAHIGVGIAGLEGAQASMSADYALGQFRFLTKLLLVHGRWCYIRIADMHANFFFKNIIWTLVYFVFTSLPVGLMGAFEQDLSANASMAFPALYKRGIYGLQYTRLKFWSYMLDGTYQSIVSFWIPYFVYFHSTSVSITGRDQTDRPANSPSPRKQSQSSSPSYALAPGGGGAAIPTATLTGVGRTTSVNRKSLSKGFHHQSIDSVEMTAVHSDYPSSSAVPSITTTYPDGDHNSGNRSRVDGSTPRGLVGFYPDHQAHLVDRHNSVGSNYRYSGLATSSPGPSPREHFNRNGSNHNINQHQQQQQLTDQSQLDYQPPNQSPHSTTQQQQRRIGAEDEQPPHSAHSNGSGWLSEDFITCNSHSQHQQLPPHQQQQYRQMGQSIHVPPLSTNSRNGGISPQLSENLVAEDLHSSHYSQLSESDYNPPSIHSNLHPSLSTPPPPPNHTHHIQNSSQFIQNSNQNPQHQFF
ncbi:hypothetical protein PSHT_02928 [Puccinia striiformis]|uniref:Phospholipid-transporting ATPase n=1 Tax=Puccinia striiformis TaxID=27350 RepID=A0A2S4WGQ6_9BASI|nr:hypothetical protein PSHT_02928 [Puccinia striiformis]